MKKNYNIPVYRHCLKLNIRKKFLKILSKINKIINRQLCKVETKR